MPWKLVWILAGSPIVLLGLFDCRHGISQGSAGREIEGDGDHRELSLMVDG